MAEVNIISMSGGKDSTATFLKAVEMGVPNIKALFADTGHEHAETYKYLDYLERVTGVEIIHLKPDFTAQIARKRITVQTKWFDDLVAGKPGGWRLKTKYKRDKDIPPPPAKPFNRRLAISTEYYKWIMPVTPLTADAAKAKIALALKHLKPTGIPFLDMCLLKGRFPSAKARFCTEELKKYPIQSYQEGLLDEYERIVAWVGVRRDESRARAQITNEWECEFGDQNGDPETAQGIWIRRPILSWTAQDVFALHDKHNIKPNPLYKMGMGRVGCMPCVMCNKAELKNIAIYCPEEIERVARWEQKISAASKTGSSTLFHVGTIHKIHDNELIDPIKHGIKSAVEWSKTSRGGRQYNFFDQLIEQPQCSSVYGLCE